MSALVTQLDRAHTSRLFWRLCGVVWTASMLAFLAGLPGQAFMVPQAFRDLRVVAVGVAEQFAINAVVVALGLLMARQVGLGLPFLSAWLAGGPAGRRFMKTLPSTLGLSVVGVALILALDRLVFLPNLGVALPANARPPVGLGLLGSLYGGIEEEVQSRLFLMTLFAWTCSRFLRPGARPGREQPEGWAASAVMWTANIMAALLFGLSHLPATAGTGISLTTIVVIRALALNGLGAVLFGWLYWKRGLESAVVAHLTFDVVAHVLVPLVWR